MAWENNVLELGLADPADLLANPLNARRHPGEQRDLLRASLDEVGWVAPVIVNARTQRMVDGHARVEEALSAGVTEIPVLYIDVDEDDERKILASYDAVGALAVWDGGILTDLLGGLSFKSEALSSFSSGLLASNVSRKNDSLFTEVTRGRDADPDLGKSESLASDSDARMFTVMFDKDSFAYFMDTINKIKKSENLGSSGEALIFLAGLYG